MAVPVERDRHARVSQCGDVTTIDVSLERAATDAELRAVEQAFKSAGFDVRATADVDRRSAEVLTWVI